MRVFGMYSGAVAGGRRILHNEKLYGLYSSPGIL